MLTYEKMLLSDKQNAALANVEIVRRIVRDYLAVRPKKRRCKTAKGLVSRLENLQWQLEEIFREEL